MDALEGTDLTGGDLSTEMIDTDGGPGPEVNAGEAPATQPTGINPAWEPLREAIGNDFFEMKALPILKGMDESAHSRITNLNAELKNYEGYKQFVEQGTDPTALQTAMQLTQLLENDPQSVYDFLGQRLGVGQEDPEEGLEQYGAGQENAMEIPPHVQAQLDQLTQFQQQTIAQQQEWAQQQQYQADLETEGKALDTAMSNFLTNNLSFTENDRGELFRMQHELTLRLQAQGLTRLATLDEAAAAINERAAYYRQRSGAQAPHILPTTTGGNVPGQQPDVTKMSKDDFVSLIASDIAASQAQS